MVDWHRNTHSTRTGGEHVPAQPLWITIIRGIQALFALLVLALAANAASYAYLDGYGMAYFTFVWTVLFLAYIFLIPRFAPQFYYFWAHVALEVLTVIWWLITMALLAHYTRIWSGRYYGYWGGGMADSTRAATAFAVLNWLLFMITLAAILFLSRRATVDGTHHTHSTTTTTNGTAPTSSFGARVSSLFSRKARTADPEAKPGTGVELGGGPTHHGTGPAGVNDYGTPYGAGTGDHGVAPPPASAPHYGEQGR